MSIVISIFYFKEKVQGRQPIVTIAMMMRSSKWFAPSDSSNISTKLHI